MLKFEENWGVYNATTYNPLNKHESVQLRITPKICTDTLMLCYWPHEGVWAETRQLMNWQLIHGSIAETV